MSIDKKQQAQLKRERLSDYLPYLAFDDKSNEFLNADNSYGYLWECIPVYFSSENTTNILSSVLKQDYGSGAVFQVMLFADTNISNYAQQIKDCDTTQTRLSKKIHQYHTDFIQDKESLFLKTKGAQLKNYRLFLSLKTKSPLETTTKVALEESLRSVGLCPKVAGASQLLSFLRSVLNGSDNNQSHYDNNKPISEQAIFADTKIGWADDSLIRINDEYAQLVTPKAYPEGENGLTELSFNEMSGAWAGGMSDLEQIPGRWIWSCNVMLDRVDHEIRSHHFFANMQRFSAKKENNIAKRINALSEALANLNTDYYLRFIPCLLLFGDNRQALSIATTRAIRMWEQKGFLMQTEDHIKHIMLLQSLPLGLMTGNKGKNIELINRHFIAPAKNIAAQLPLQGDYRGFGKPVVPFVGRKWQVQGLDIYDDLANNHNMLCVAETGGGKSFFFNWFISHYFNAGAKIRIIDIGDSYKKICGVLGGAFLDVSKTTPNFNPFLLSTTVDLNKTYVQKSADEYDEKDKKHDIDSVVAIMGAMCYSTTGSALTEEENGLITHAVKDVVAKGIVKNGIDAVQDYLTNLEKYTTHTQIPDSLKARAKELAFNLCEFSSKGNFGKYFNSEDDNDWLANRFVVLELESLLKKKALMRVISLQVVNMMTADMYQGDRSVKKIFILEEIAKLLSSSKFMQKVAEDGYRRARKYNGSFGAVFQSPMDIKLFGQVGQVMKSNSAFKFFLQSNSYEEAIANKVISLSPFEAKLLTSIQSNRPHYSELFMMTPRGVGISRLLVDPYGYALATTTAHEVEEIKAYEQQGLSIEDALEKFAQKRGLRINETQAQQHEHALTVK